MDMLKNNTNFSKKAKMDETDRCENHVDEDLANKSTSRPPMTPSSASVYSNVKSRIPSANKVIVTNGQVGGVDEETFLNSFNKVPPLRIYSGKDVDEHLRKFHEILKNDNEDWNKRVDSLKKIRSLILAGALNYDEFYDYLNMLLPSFHSCVKDLRSMVVRETCITIAYLSKSLELKLDHFAESVLSSLINLIQSSKKVMASSGLVCIQFILQYTHTPRLIPILVSNLSSKSKAIRRACCEFLNFVLQSWHPHSMEKHLALLQEGIKKGIADADAEARQFSRQAFSAFAQKFPEPAESLKNSLDFTYRKLLLSGSNSGSSTSLSKPAGGTSGDAAKLLTRNATSSMSCRSNSAIDLQAVRRAKARAQYAAMARQKFGSGTPSVDASHVKNVTPATDQRVGRTKSRISVSQPSSRSGSPSSKFNSYSHYLTNSRSASRSRKSSLGNDTSRETSPTRSPYGFKSRLSSTHSPRKTVMHTILQQSRDAETDLADALGTISDISSPHFLKPSSRNIHRNLEDHSDESETSSMCSENSFDSYRRPSDSASWSGSQHRLYREMNDAPLRDVADIIVNCESPHWNERKNGLMSLQFYFQDGNKLELSELRRIMDTFLKIFNDPHVKVFSLFLDTLNELIQNHGTDLCFCLHLLLTRLFNKLGADLLNSVHSKLMKTLDNVFRAFPHDSQIQSVFRFLVDPTQTPNNRVKLATLGYLVKLTTVANPSATFSPNPISKDYSLAALTKLLSWTMSDNAKTTPELRKASQDAVLALFNLNPAQVTCRLSTMPVEYQETAATIFKNASPALRSNEGVKPNFVDDYSPCSFNSSTEVNLSHDSVVAKEESPADNGYDTFCETFRNNVNFRTPSDVTAEAKISETSKFNNNSVRFHSNHIETSYETEGTPSFVENCTNDLNSTIDYGVALKTCLDELAAVKDDQQKTRKELSRIASLVRESHSEPLITHFKALLGKIVSFMSSSESPPVKEAALNLLHLIVERKTVTFLLKNFSDLVITKVIALCGDTSKDVIKAAENCALLLATHLPAESIVRITVPLITSEVGQMKLVAIKMLTRLVKTSDDLVVYRSIDQIMPVLLVAYDDDQSSVRKAAVFCIVALHRQSDEMRASVEPYIMKLQGAKLKLLQLYIQRAE